MQKHQVTRNKSKESQDFYMGNKEIEINSRRAKQMEDFTFYMTSIFTKLTCRFSVITIKIPHVFSLCVNSDSKIYRHKWAKNNQDNLEEQSCRI